MQERIVLEIAFYSLHVGELYSKVSSLIKVYSNKRANADGLTLQLLAMLFGNTG
ncbi:MAG: hypothetical protein R3D26_21940 [Cyanobacteriota/Melainabacteria group bacterium]